MAVIRKANDAYLIEGHLDDTFDYTPLAAGPFPLKIRFGGVTGVNSVGARAFMRFLQAYRDRGVEFHELSDAMVDLLNCIPGMLGNPADPSIVKSLYITWQCDDCRRSEPVLMTFDAGLGVPRILPRFCSRCRGEMHTAHDPADYFIFIAAGD